MHTLSALKPRFKQFIPRMGQVRPHAPVRLSSVGSVDARVEDLRLNDLPKAMRLSAARSTPVAHSDSGQAAHAPKYRAEKDRRAPAMRRCGRTGPKVCACAMPIDTAVTATTSPTARAPVASNSTPARRLENFFSETGEAKPTFPGSVVIVRYPSRIGLRESHDRGGARLPSGQSLAKLLTNKGNFVVLVNEELTRQAAERINRKCALRASENQGSGIRGFQVVLTFEFPDPWPAMPPGWRRPD